MTDLDHVVWAVPSITPVAECLRRDHGLATLPGGSHAAWGTRNAIVPLSGAYLELVEVAHPAVATYGFGRAVAESAARGGGLILWCVRAGDIEAEARERGVEVIPGSRRNDDGTVVTWRVAGLPHSLTNPTEPFLITWDDPAAIPGSLPVDHPAGPARISYLDLGPRGPRRVTITHPRGDVILPANPSPRHPAGP